MGEINTESGFEVNGIADYWGKYASVDKIVELAATLKTEDDWFSFYFPSVNSNGKFSHKISIHNSEPDGFVELEFHESSSQCGSYFKKVALSDLGSEIENLREVEKSPESQGFVYEEW